MSCSERTLGMTVDRGQSAPGFSRILLAGFFLFGALLAGNAVAHDFFLWPDKSRAARAEPIDIRFSVGHGGDYDRWSHGQTKVITFVDDGPLDSQDLSGKLDRSSSSVRFDAEGTHVISMTTSSSSSTLAADKFNDYLREEGLTAVADHRAEQGLTGQPGREHYSRCAKTLLQIGGNASDNATRVQGLKLEIVPMTNPYALAAGQPLSLRVYYDGLPLPGARVSLESLGVAGAERHQLTSDSGEVTFEMSRVGQWKVNVVWSVPVENVDTHDFETIFSSLTFGAG